MTCPSLSGCPGPVFPNPAKAHLLGGGRDLQWQGAWPPGKAAAGGER